MAMWYSRQSPEFKAEVLALVGREHPPAAKNLLTESYARGEWFKLQSAEAKQRFFEDWVRTGPMPRRNEGDKEERSMALWYSKQSSVFKTRIEDVVEQGRGPEGLAPPEMLFASGSWLALTSTDAKKGFFEAWLGSAESMPRKHSSDVEEKAMAIWYDNLRRTEEGRDFRQRIAGLVEQVDKRQREQVEKTKQDALANEVAAFVAEHQRAPRERSELTPESQLALKRRRESPEEEKQQQLLTEELQWFEGFIADLQKFIETHGRKPRRRAPDEAEVQLYKQYAKFRQGVSSPTGRA